MQRQLSAVLLEIAKELDSLARASEALQSGLVHCADCAQELTSDAASTLERAEKRKFPDDLVAALQRVDYVTQSLQCLAAFISGAATRIAPEYQADLTAAVGSVWLSSLRSRLSGRPTEAGLGDEVELFVVDDASM